MNYKRIEFMVAAVMLLSFVLAACGPAATEVPPTATMVPFEAMTYSAPDCEYGGLMKSIEAVDELTVKFTMCRPDPAFLSKVAFVPFAIQPAEYLESTGGGGEGSALLEKPIGTGPYMLSEWKRGEEVIFAANPDYWGEAPKSKTFVLRWSTEAAQRLLELQSGTVDGIDNPGPDDFPKIEADSNLQLMRRRGAECLLRGYEQHLPSLR